MIGPEIDEDLEIEFLPVPVVDEYAEDAEQVDDADDDNEKVVFIRHWDEPTRKKVGVAPEVLARRKKIKQWAIGVAVSLVVVSGALTYLLWPDPVPTVPPGLAGVWRTEAPRYLDRALEITTSNVLFHNGTPNPATYQISALTAFPEDSATRVEIEYAVKRQQYVVSLVYRTEPVPVISLASQPEMKWYQGLRPDEDSTLLAVDEIEYEAALSPLSADFLNCIRAVQKAAQTEAAAAQRCTNETGEVVKRDTALIEAGPDPFLLGVQVDSTASRGR
jgi:hypothetical protein